MEQMSKRGRSFLSNCCDAGLLWGNNRGVCSYPGVHSISRKYRTSAAPFLLQLGNWDSYPTRLSPRFSPSWQMFCSLVIPGCLQDTWKDSNEVALLHTGFDLQTVYKNKSWNGKSCVLLSWAFCYCPTAPQFLVWIPTPKDDFLHSPWWG